MSGTNGDGDQADDAHSLGGQDCECGRDAHHSHQGMCDVGCRLDVRLGATDSRQVSGFRQQAGL